MDTEQNRRELFGNFNLDITKFKLMFLRKSNKT